MTTNKLTPPADLDPSRLHHPSEVRAHKVRVAAYHEAKREEEERQLVKESTGQAAANRALSDDEWFAEAVKRHAEAQAKLAEREAERKAEKDAATAYLESSPELAEVTADNPYQLLVKVEHWIKRGYCITEESVQFWLPNFQHVVLAAPVSAKGGKQ